MKVQGLPFQPGEQQPKQGASVHGCAPGAPSAPEHFQALLEAPMNSQNSE